MIFRFNQNVFLGHNEQYVPPHHSNRTLYFIHTLKQKVWVDQNTTLTEVIAPEMLKNKLYLIPRSKVLLEKVKMVKITYPFYRTRRFIIVFIKCAPLDGIMSRLYPLHTSVPQLHIIFPSTSASLQLNSDIHTYMSHFTCLAHAFNTLTAEYT